MKKLCCFILLFNLFLFPIHAEKSQPQDTIQEFGHWDTFYDLLQNGTKVRSTLTKVERVGKLDNGAYITMMELDGVLAYCLDPTILASLGEGFSVDYDFLSWEQKDLLWKYSYYGYGYSGHESKEWYAATQMCIWHELGFYVDAYTMQGSLWDLSSMISEIRDLAYYAGERPSFNGQQFELNFKESYTIYDTNNALHHYSISSKNGVDLVANGNQLTMTIQDINYDKNFSFSYDGYNSCLVYVKPGSQSVMTVSRNEPGSSFDFKIKMVTGDLIVNKLDEYLKPVPSAHQFQLFYDEMMTQPVVINGVSVFSTDNHGLLKLLNILPPLEYKLKEVSATHPFVLNPDEFTVTLLPRQINTIDVINQYRDVQLIIEKSDEEEPDLKLNGAVFEIKDVTDMHAEETTIQLYKISRNSVIQLANYFNFESYQISNDKATIENGVLMASSTGPFTLVGITSSQKEFFQFLVVDDQIDGINIETTTADNDPYFPSLLPTSLQFKGTTGETSIQFVDMRNHNLPLSNTEIFISEDSDGLYPIGNIMTDEVGMVDIELPKNQEFYWKRKEDYLAQPFTVNDVKEGQLIINHLKWGRTYSVCEIKSPDGYELPEDNCQTITMNLDEDIHSLTFPLTNRKRRLDLHFYKADTENLDTKLDNAVFQFNYYPIQNFKQRTKTLGFTGKLYWHTADENGLPRAGVQYYIDTEESFINPISVFTDVEGDVVYTVDDGTYFVKEVGSEMIERYEVKKGQIFFEDLVYGDRIEVCEVVAPVGYHLAQGCRTITVQADDALNEISFNFDNGKIKNYEEIVPNMGI